MSVQRPGGVLKRVHDNRLRPLLSNHFNPNEFLKSVIREGRSEEVLKEINVCIEEVNEEIKQYITQHRDGLMSGMQDVATLAEKYSMLQNMSQKLHRSVERLKKEALQSYDLVNQRTAELERIHSASTSLRYLRQFSHAKSQLEHILKGLGPSKEGVTIPDSALLSNIVSNGSMAMDIRQMATAAKTISDLESLLDLPALADIKYVAEHASAIRQFGMQLRRRAQDRLLVSLKERDQASVASSLQVFFNLQSLPEIVMLAVDATVRQTVEASRIAIDLDGIVAAFPELASHIGTRAAAVAAVLGGGPKAPAGPASASQIRVALREAAHQWATLVHEHASQVHVLQRVVAKKEDPASHKRFIDVLRFRVAQNSANGAQQQQSSAQLASGRLLDLFWERLNEPLQDVAAEKMKAQPLAANRIYPCLRKAAVEIVDSLRALSARDLQRDLGGGVLSQVQVAGAAAHDNTAHLAAPATSVGLSQDGGMFGSLALPQDELLGLLGVGTSSAAAHRRSKTRAELARQKGFGGIAGGGTLAAAPTRTHHAELVEQGLVRGLGPMRDRYLVGCYNRMSHPVTQMFPEMEGYTAAVPSKRDLQALIKALQSELVNVAVESEVGLLRAVSREALKAIHLMASKIEGMVLSSSDSLREVLQLSSQQKPGQQQQPSLRSSAQDHNTQLIVLLGSLRESLEKLPSAVLKLAQEAPGSALGAGSALLASNASDELSSSDVGSGALGAGGSSVAPAIAPHEAASAAVLAELQTLVGSASAVVEELTARQLVSPLVEVLAAHCKGLIFALPKEGVAQVSGTTGSNSNSRSDAECSRAAQAVVKQLPELVKAHLGSLPPSLLVTAATEELCIRVMHAYISAAALVRPVTDASRMRAAKDLTALEVMVAAVAPGVAVRESCPVIQEFKAFRRFLFNDEGKGAAEVVPSRSQLQALPYFAQLRPSTVLHMAIARATAQMPLPHETQGANASIQSYLTDVTDAAELSLSPEVSRDFAAGSFRALTTIRSSYSDNWRAVPSELACWQCVQASLDVLVQRTAVADGAQKLQMRAWYDAILELGTMYFR